MHLDAATFTANQSCFAQHLEMLRESGFWDRLVADFQEGRTTLRAFGFCNLDEDLNSHGIGQGIQDALHRDVIGSRMKQRTQGALFVSG